MVARPRIGAGSRKGIQVEGTACTKAWGGGDWRWDVRQPRSCAVCLERRRLLLGADALPATAPGPACAPALCSDGGHRSQLPEGRVVPGRPRHQPPPAGSPQAASPEGPHSAQLAAPALGQPRFLPLPLSSSSCFSGRVLSHSAPVSKAGRTDRGSPWEPAGDEDVPGVPRSGDSGGPMNEG